MNCGKELKYHREAQNLTQSDLAKATGFSQAAISLWEENKRAPSIDSCIVLADFYKITLDDLVGRECKD